jgi:hypothetical protein
MEFWFLMMISMVLMPGDVGQGLMEVEGLAVGQRHGQSVIDNKRS